MNKAEFLSELKKSGFKIEDLFELHKKVKGTIYASDMRYLLEWYSKLNGWEPLLLNYKTVHELIGFPLSVANLYRLNVPKKKYRTGLKSYIGKDIFLYLVQGTGGNFPSYYSIINEVTNFEDKLLIESLTKLSLSKNVDT